MAAGRYISIAEVKAEIPADILARLTDDDASKSPAEKVIDDTKIANAISYAEARLDNRIAKRYKTPIALTSLTEDAARDDLKRAALNYTIHRLYSRIENPLAHADKKRDADKWTDNVAKGFIELVGAEAHSRTRIHFTARKAIFGTVGDPDYDQEQNP